MTTHRLIAVLHDGRKILHPRAFNNVNEATDMWFANDDARIAGERPLVKFYAVREQGHEYTVGATTQLSPFRDHSDDKLNGREYAELLGALQIARDKLRADGYTGDGVQAIYEKLSKGCTPRTNGLEFRLI